MRLYSSTAILILLAAVTVLGILAVKPSQNNAVIVISVLGYLALGWALLVIWLKLDEIIHETQQNRKSIDKYLSDLVQGAVANAIWDRLQDDHEKKA